jgi:hypothetical protein
MFTDLSLWQIEGRRSELRGDVWHDGDEVGDQIRHDLDAMIEEVTRLRALEKSLKQGAKR